MEGRGRKKGKGKGKGEEKEVQRFREVLDLAVGQQAHQLYSLQGAWEVFPSKLGVWKYLKEHNKVWKGD